MNGVAEKINSTNNKDEWDMSDVAAFNDGEKKMPNTIEEMQFWCREYNAAEQQFAHYTKRINLKTLNSDEQERYRETVAKYEDDIAYDWHKISDATNVAWSRQLIRSDYELAATQSLGSVEPEETVEAATGIFYDERTEILNQQILAREQNHEAISDRAILYQTWRKVWDYIRAATDYDFLHRDYASYQDVRRTCHNKMIQQLNTINQLAEKYNTPRFTPRDFMTNDFSYDRIRDHGSQLDWRANYDRETVLAYFRTAFANDFDAAEREAIQSSRDLRAGMVYYD